jgi:hypothetical protein
MLALIAAQEAAVIASGHGPSLMAPIGTGTVDGFAAGMLLSAVVFMLILAQRRGWRRPVRAEASGTPAEPTALTPALASALDDALGENPPSPLAAPVEAPAFAPVLDPALSTHPYAHVRPYGGMNSGTGVMPFADAANEVLLQPGIRLEEWLEGQMRRPSLPRSGHAPAADHDEEEPPAPVPAAVAAAEATTAVVPVTPAPEDAEDDDTAHQNRGPVYRSKHRMPGRNDSKPWSENHRRTARHAAASSARSGAMSRRFGLRPLRPVSAGD